MTEAYNDALNEQMKKNVWDRLASEATSMSPIEYATVTADIAGIFDPTPISDGAGLVLSAAQLDGWGVLCSLVSFVPYAGDALGKPAKIAKNAPKTAKAIEAFLKMSDELAGAGKTALKNSGLGLDKIAAARKQALERVQKAMLDARKKIANCDDCKKLVGKSGENRGLQMPSGKPNKHGKRNGEWVGGEQPIDGNGVFKFEEPKTLPDGRTVKEIEYRNGAPNFDDYVEGPKYDLWEVTGKADKDGSELTKLMRETDPKWKPPDHKKFVLHHFEDGKVGYVPREIHDKKFGGVAHSGGNSMTNNELF